MGQIAGLLRDALRRIIDQCSDVVATNRELTSPTVMEALKWAELALGEPEEASKTTERPKAAPYEPAPNAP